MLHAAQSIPSLIVTNPTPIKSSCAPSIAATAENSTRTPSRCSTARLLYRGALSLPDSHLPLDGLTFTIDLHPSSSAFRVGSNEHGHVGHDALFETPLPLALESMRGRPNLPALGTVKMNEIVCDMSERVNLHIHPRSILTRQYFSEILCTTPVSASKGYTDLGIRIRLGDAPIDAANISTSTQTSGIDLTSEYMVGGSNIDGNTDIVVFGRPHPSSSVMQLCVARILPASTLRGDGASKLNDLTKENSRQPRQNKLRPPRPDDPTPRKPPPGGFGGMTRIGLGIKRSRGSKVSGKEKGKEKGMDMMAAADGRPKKRERKYEAEILSTNPGPESEVDHTHSRVSGTFKIPHLPARRVSLSTSLPEEDVFGCDAGPVISSKPRRDNISNPDKTADLSGASASDIEGYNKLLIKKTAQKLMTAAGIGQTHSLFKEFFNLVYQGTKFALRTKLNVEKLDESECSELVDRIAQTHITLYLGGKGVGVYLLQ